MLTSQFTLLSLIFVEEFQLDERDEQDDEEQRIGHGGSIACLDAAGGEAKFVQIFKYREIVTHIGHNLPVSILQRKKMADDNHLFSVTLYCNYEKPALL